MKRYFALAAAFGCIALVVLVRSGAVSPRQAATAAVQWDVPDSELHVEESSAGVLFRGPQMPVAPGSLSARGATQRISQLYGLQSGILQARSNGNAARVNALFDRALASLDSLVRRPALAAQPRFREAYRSIVTEYEDYYGVPDTLSLPQGDIFRERARIFEAVNNAAAGSSPSLAEADTTALRPRKTTVPLPYNDLVRSAMTYLQREPEKHVYRWMKRKETYFPMIEHIFAEEGVPDELKYLAMVESGLKPGAESWASAAGIWQFMPTTGRAYGLTINPWVDERLDPVKATRAAAKHLKDLHRMFDGNWLLALSGYNCSPTKIRRAMRKVRRQGKTPTFWNIYPHIPRETRNYVPTFVAAALMISNPQVFDLKRVRPGPRYQFDYVPVNGMLSLETLSDLSGATKSRLRALNPELRRAALPPSAEPYYVRIPYGTFDQFARRYQQLPDSARNGLLAHTVRSGETLGAIAERYGVKKKEIARLNELEHAMIQAGDELAIPKPRLEGNAELLAETDAAPMRVRYPSRSVRPLAANGARENGSTLAGRRLMMHRVKPGDTISEIADAYGVTVSQIKAWNDLHSSSLDQGERLQVYGG
jgi:membrane-bound lytic murein transglycosylase D